MAPMSTFDEYPGAVDQSAFTTGCLFLLVIRQQV
jgi:hypothetical protein